MEENNVLEKSIAEQYPYYFKLEAGDLPWYESMGFDMLFNNITTELEKAAQEHSMKSINEPEDHFESLDNCSDDFCKGACWYMGNYDKLIKLPTEQYENAIVIAQILHAKEVCEDLYVSIEDRWTQYDAFNYICAIESDFAAGVSWAEKRSK